MLDGLDQIEWKTLHSTYGPATEIPDLLRAIAGSDEAARRRALEDLFQVVCHQSTLSEASAVVVPFLARLARQGEMPSDDRALLVSLLGGIAAGIGYFQGLDISHEAEHLAPAREAVGREAPGLFADLVGVDERMDWCLVQLAGQVPESAASAVPLIVRMRDRMRNSYLLAALDLTAAMIASTATSATLDAAAAALRSEGTEIGADPKTRADPARCGRLLADGLYWTGFDETHMSG